MNRARRPRARLVSLVAALVIAGLSSWAMAQAYPTRPIRVVVPFAAGGTADLAARINRAKDVLVGG